MGYFQERLEYSDNKSMFRILRSLNDNIYSIVPIVTCITNVNAVMPGLLKQAIVRPLLKKPSLDQDTLINYRPVGNLNHVSKVIEKVIARRIICHISDQRMQDCFQSAYRKKIIQLKPHCYVLQMP